jgi:alpha-ribazole phosphatase
MACEITFVRHPAVNAAGICYGQHDVDLKEPAEKAAAHLKQLAAITKAERIWTSPWERAISVAEILHRDLGVTLSIDPRLSELSFGEWEGRPFSELESTDKARYEDWMHNWQESSAPGGEKIADLQGRVREWIEERRHSSEREIVITHAGVIRAARTVLRGITYSEAMAEPVEHLALETYAV